MFGVGIGFMAFTSIVMVLRLWVRIFMLRALGTDDGKICWPARYHAY